MIPAAFEYLRPASVAEAIDLLRQHGDDARLLAGGHSLLPLMKLRLASPRYLVDLGRIGDLTYISEESGTIRIGALTTHAEIERSELLKARLPLLPDVARRIGDVQVRNRGTIGGSLAHAHPAADLAAAALALEAQLRVQGPGGLRTVSASDFFVGMFTTALRSDEVLVEIQIPPLPSGSGSAYARAEEKASHFALVGVAAIVAMDGESCRLARIGVSGVAACPFRAHGFEAALSGRRLDQQSVSAAAARVTEEVTPIADLFASEEYRRHLAHVYAARAVMRALLAAPRSAGVLT